MKMVKMGGNKAIYKLSSCELEEIKDFGAASGRDPEEVVAFFKKTSGRPVWMTIPAFTFTFTTDFNLHVGTLVSRLALVGHRESETIQARLLKESELFIASL